MLTLYILTGLLLMLSFYKSQEKSFFALKIAAQRLMKMAPAFMLMLILVAILLTLIPDEVLMNVLEKDNKWLAVCSALGVGSISVMPGFIAFPLCGILLDQGALYMVLSAFSTTLMMVGVVTFPFEKAYLGGRLAIYRNLSALSIALCVALITGLVFGELF